MKRSSKQQDTPNSGFNPMSKLCPLLPESTRRPLSASLMSLILTWSTLAFPSSKTKPQLSAVVFKNVLDGGGRRLMVVTVSSNLIPELKAAVSTVCEEVNVLHSGINEYQDLESNNGLWTQGDVFFLSFIFFLFYPCSLCPFPEKLEVLRSALLMSTPFV